MKLIASLALSFALLAGLTGCAKEPPAAPAKAAAAGPATGTQTWICPMDKEVVADKPGSCPKCGMKLELKQ